MTEHYFKNQLQKLNCPKDILKAIKRQLYSSTEKIAKLFESKFKIPKTRPDFSDVISTIIKKLDSADIELNIRLEKLKEAKKYKKHLEAKLQFLTSSIEDLTHQEETERSKFDLRDSQVRHDFFEKEKLKSKTPKKKLKKYLKDHKIQSEKIQKRLTDLEQEIQSEKSKELHLAAKKQEEKRKLYQDYLQKLQEKSSTRKKELKLQETYLFSSKVPKPKPLFIQLSERFMTHVEMPELEKRKQQLSEKRLACSYSSKNIQDHGKWYSDFKKESILKRRKEQENHSVDRKFQVSEQNLSSWQARIMEEEKVLKEEKIKEHKDFLNRLDRKAQYSSLVKQLYSPSVARKSMESIKEQGKTERVLRDSKEKEEWKPHKFKPNKMIPPPLVRKDFEVIDYLQEFRVKKKEEEEEKERKDAEKLMNELKAQIFLTFSDPHLKKKKTEDSPKIEKKEKQKNPKQETEKLDKEILKKEWKINSSSKVNLKLSQEVNNLYLSSIRAKLSFLENIQSN
jgi:hypothetical protein